MGRQFGFDILEARFNQIGDSHNLGAGELHKVTIERGAQWRFSIQIFIVGFMFLVAASFFPETMAPNVYGYMTYDTPAEIWAAGFMAASGLVLYGLHINGRWFWSPMIRGAGYALIIMLFGIVSWSAASTKDGLHLTIFGGAFFIPQALFFLRIAFADMRGRFSVGKFGR